MKIFHASLISATVFVMVVGCKSSCKDVSSEPSGAAVGSSVITVSSPVTVSSPITVSSPVSSTANQKGEFLFVQNAKDVSFDKGTMTLHEVNPVTVCFTDRPERIAGHMPTANMIPMWSEGKDSFLHDPPNATLSLVGETNANKVSDVVMVLSNPRMSGSDLTYDIRVLEGTPPAHGSDCSLFIDIIGMPLTPYSYAGAARRAYRSGYMHPGYMYPGAYGPAFVPVAPVAVGPLGRPYLR